MGNAASSPEHSSSGGGAEHDNNANSTSESGPLFRLAMYRGERDAFLITDNEEEEELANNYIGGSGGNDEKLLFGNENSTDDFRQAVSPPPHGTQVGLDFPNVLGDQEDGEFLSPPQLYRERPIGEPFFRDNAPPLPSYNSVTSNHKRSGSNSNTLTASPPSLISSANSVCSSNESYGTCISSAEAPDGNNNIMTYDQTGSTNLKLLPRIVSLLQRRKSSTTTTSSTSTTIAVNQSRNKPGVFDCVKIPKSSSSNNKIKKSSSLSLFDSCVRLSAYDEDDHCDNEYYHSNNHTDYNKSPFHKRSSSQSSNFSTSSSSTTAGYYFNPISVAAPISSAHLKSNSISSLSTLYAAQQQQQYTQSELDMVDGDEPTYESDLTRIRNYHVVTTAALPWMTGTGVNPLLRAGYLVKRNMELKKKQQQEEEEAVVEGMEGVFVDANDVPVESDVKSSCCSLDYSCFTMEEEAAEKNGLISGGKEMTVGKEPEGVNGEVTLVVPWLVDRSEREMLYGGNVFEDMDEQEVFIREWLSVDAGMTVEAKELKILFYPARYHKSYNSIFALDDICDLLPSDDTADVCILEEPEHLNWYRAPGSSLWTSKFCHCVGVIHTNYKAYARDHAPAGFLAAPLLAGVNSLIVKANCHKVVKLSGVLQEFIPGREVVENTHGIRQVFLEEGLRRANSALNESLAVNSKPTPSRGAYFIGKLLWAKGFDLMLELQKYYYRKTGNFFDIDIFGSGPDEEEIRRAFNGGLSEKENGKALYSFMGNSRQHRPMPANFMGRLDHSKLAGDKYSIFINPSLTEVLCTTTAEAIAMGKWVVIPSHPSNEFFEQFPNCLMYRSRRGFVTQLKTALENDPPQLSSELADLLSWDAATLRVVTASALSKRDAARNERLTRAKDLTTSPSLASVSKYIMYSSLKIDFREGPDEGEMVPSR